MENRTCYHCFQPLDGVGPCPHCGYDEAADAGRFPLALAVGSVLNGRYILGHPLGQGGFGITYVAQDVQTGRQVAIKEYFPETMVTRTQGHTVSAFSGQRQENFLYGKQCFLAEAQTLAQFNNVENIVGVHSYFEENGTAYFVMEYVDGVSLQKYLRKKGGKIGWEEARSILFPIMDALSTVHSQGIIHRDVSPDNICITRDGKVKLLDFGAARYSLGDRSRSLDVVLKAGYAPKEQYSRRGRQGPYTDVYSMAATFYYALSNRLPPESVDREEEDELIPLSSLGVKLPQEAEDALEKGLAVRASDRFQTMREFRQALAGEDAGAPFAPVIPAGNTWAEPVHSGPVSGPSFSHSRPQPAPPVSQPLVSEQPVFHSQPLYPEPPVSSPQPEKPANNRPDGKKTLLIAAVLAVVVIGCVLIPVLGRGSRYSKAEKALKNKNFSEAYALFEELGSFRDSEERALDVRYREAHSLLESGEHDAARQIFLDLGSYGNSENLASECLYQKALYLLGNGSHDEAYRLFQQLGNYEDSKDMVREVLYQQALQTMSDKDYPAAYDQLTRLDGYKDADDQIISCKNEWVDQILFSSHGADAFKNTVIRNDDDYDMIYSKVLDYIESHDSLDQWLGSNATNRVKTVSSLLETLPSSQKDTRDLLKLFKDIGDGDLDSGKEYIRGNMELLRTMWRFRFIQEFLLDDSNISYFMEGKWTTSDNRKYIEFYKNNEGGTTCTISFTCTPKPANTKYFDIVDSTYIWTDEDSKELAKVLQFTFSDFDTVSVYSYYDKQSYRMTR